MEVKINYFFLIKILISKNTFESEKGKSEIAILKCETDGQQYPDDIVKYFMDTQVLNFVGHKGFTQYIDERNPYIRVVVFNINALDFQQLTKEV